MSGVPPKVLPRETVGTVGEQQMNGEPTPGATRPAVRLPVRDHPRVDPDEDVGGDPVCWLDRVCPECGGFLTEARPTRCERCGTDLAVE
jgi:hypothetical protein